MKKTSTDEDEQETVGAGSLPKSLNEFLGREAKRAQERRNHCFGQNLVPRTDSVRHDRYADDRWRSFEDSTWAIALSGGGIRSATFNLGVLQALAMPRATALAGIPPASRRQMDHARVKGPLALFDYISSVSGGGYVAGALQSLFVPRANNAPSLASVYSHMEQDPPPRVTQGVKPPPLAWLRENGRYLAPSGAGDMAYMVGLSVRNWIGVQWLIGAPIVFLVALTALAEHYLEGYLSGSVMSWWTLPVAVFLLWSTPCAGAYWMTRMAPESGHSGGLPHRRAALVAFIALLLVGPIWVPWALGLLGLQDVSTDAKLLHSGSWAQQLVCAGALLVFSVAWALAVRFSGTGHAAPPREVLPRDIAAPRPRWWNRLKSRLQRNASVADLAVALTKWFTRSLKVIVCMLVFTCIFDLSRWMLVSGAQHVIAVLGGVAALVSSFYQRAVKFIPALRGVGSSTSERKGSSRRMTGVALGALGIILALLVGIFWTTVTFWLMIPPEYASATAMVPLPTLAWRRAIETNIRIENVVGMLAVSSLFCVVVGRWMSILNMSGYHFLYSSRLTRAYLGAANPKRTTAGNGGSLPTSGTAEPDADDAVSYGQYHQNLAAPIHLINITVNQTVDPAEQLVQRDRKGQPFVVLPYLTEDHKDDVGDKAALDVSIGDRVTRVEGSGRLLKIGDWLAVSGAAVSTGLGRQTSAGAAISVTMVNARVGRWWAGRQERDRSWWRWQMPTYAYLLDELRAKFHGAQRQYLYLTDGGHFENTATYELLRRAKDPVSRIRFIFMCDCGADQNYRYDQLANLVRLARVDFKLEVKVNLTATETPELSEVFGTPETLGAANPDSLDKRCAVLLDVFDAADLKARIVMIKPRLISCVSADLLAYYRSNPTFPHQTTGDQFFDDEQWESYRKLGLECCHAILDLGEPFWKLALAA